MVDKNILRKWVEALESGKFKQNKIGGYCKVSESGKVTHHCCLAVLDHTIGGEALVKWNYDKGYVYGTKGGLTKRQRDKFATLNDFEEMDFKNIAKVIRAWMID